MFLYPEELEHVGSERLAGQVLELGCDAVSVAVAYHRARRVFPRHGRVSQLPETVVYVAPELRRYRALVPAAVASPELCARLLRFREACERVGLRFHAWVVGLHHDGIARAHPEASARTLDGSPTGHSLCPSAPEAIEYVAALAADVVEQLAPDGFDLEAGFYPAWEPSYTLTLALEPLSEAARLLGSQCFCPSCRALLGPCAAELEERARAAAGPPFGRAGAFDEGVAVELALARAGGARRLIEAVAASVREQGSVLRVFASGPPTQAALQGVSPEAAAAADDLLLGCGQLRGDELQVRFDGLRELVGRSGTPSVNWTPERSPTALAADAERLARSGAEGLALYNLSLVPDAGLEAFRAAATAFRAAVTVR